MTMEKNTRDLELTRDKWEGEYKRQLENGEYRALEERYHRDVFPYVYRQLSAAKPLRQGVFLEIGCGQMFLGQLVARECKLVIGIDLSFSALQIAKRMLERKGIKNYLLILADVRRIPLKDEFVDLLYGGGVIEHFPDTAGVICEMQRVLKRGGIAFNAVPYLNLGTLTYRQIWGNIPDFPVLKQLAELVHVRLLRGRHMKFGYELSFTAGQMKSLHGKAGFRKVSAGKFDTKLMFDFIPSRFLKKICTHLADNYSLFWPMIKVVAEK